MKINFKSPRFIEGIVFAVITLFMGGMVFTQIGGSEEPHLAWEGIFGASHLGQSVAGAGDFNGDGRPDVIIGAPSNPYSFTAQGSTYAEVNSGNDGQNLKTHFGNSLLDRTGWSVDGLGDVTYDGKDDVVVGAPGEPYSPYATGFTYILSNQSVLTFTAQTSGDAYGYSVSKAGDLTGDGIQDFIVGAPNANNYGGSIYLYNGALTLFGSSSFAQLAKIDSIQSWERFGSSVSDAGDVNGDGYADIIVGAENLPYAYVFLGSPGGINFSPIVLTSTGWSFGNSVSGAGDVNGDGFDDVLVGEKYAGSIDEGKVYIYLGNSSGLNVNPLVLSGSIVNGYFGTSVSSAGDINNDGRDEIIVGSPGISWNPVVGKATVFTLNPATNSFDVMREYFGDPVGGDLFGESVADAGDINGDGFADVIVGAPLRDRTLGGTLLENAGFAGVYRIGGAEAYGEGQGPHQDIDFNWSYSHATSGTVNIVGGTSLANQTAWVAVSLNSSSWTLPGGTVVLVDHNQPLWNKLVVPLSLDGQGNYSHVIDLAKTFGLPPGTDIYMQAFVRQGNIWLASNGMQLTTF